LFICASKNNDLIIIQV
jgi:hypothetical protein